MASSVNMPSVANSPSRASLSPTSSSSSYRSLGCSKLLPLPVPLVTKNNNAHFLRRNRSICRRRISISPLPNTPAFKVVASAKREPLKIMISGAPASGKGTQCELITQKYRLVHISAGDLLRAEIASGSANGKQAKEYMEKGQLVPDGIVVMMVKERLSRPDSQEHGWLLDGYPRSSSQATALREFGFQPDLFILLDVPEEILVERVVGRRLDPVTGKIYHLKYSPPETEEIAARLIQRFDDTEEKVKLRLQTHNQNVEAVLSMYEDITIKVKGDGAKEEVFAQIDSALTKLLEERTAPSGSLAT